MKNELVKKLTGKNPKDYEFAASTIINDSDSKSFEILVSQSDFLFDFIKQNVSKRLLNATNQKNYKNLLNFLKIYSSDYEDSIILPLTKYADEDLTDEMLERFEKGSDEEKAYAAKYFSIIKDSLAIEMLRENSYSDFLPLATNCAHALSQMNDEMSYNQSIEKLKSKDEFEKLSAVQFLIAYNNPEAAGEIFEAMKTSSMPENIASELSYLKSFLEFLETEFKYDTILALNHILNGLGEIVSLSQVFDFELYEVILKLAEMQKELKEGKIALVLLNAKLKFEQLTENDEYLFDEDKNTKDEILAIKQLLESQNESFWEAQKEIFKLELDESSDFVLFALQLCEDLNENTDLEKLKPLLSAKNQTVILKTVEVIKSLKRLFELDKNKILTSISDENIKAVIEALF